MNGLMYKQILTREMTRKEFLQLVFGLVVAAFGFSRFISMLTSTNSTPESDTANKSHGFGSSKFGL